MLEKFLAAEVLEVRVLHPAIAQSLVGKVVGVLEDRYPRHQPRRQWRLARLVGVDRPKRLLQKSPIDRPRQLHQRVFHIDDLVNFARCVGSRAAQKSRAKAGLSLQEEPSNVTFTIDDYQTSAAVCTRDVMAITKMRFLTCVCLHRVDEVARER